MVTLLEQFHRSGYAYNDLKLDNICVGNYDGTDPQELKLIDFGMCT